MKTIVEIECPNVDIMTVHNIRNALRYYFPHFSFTVTELPPQVEERSCENCKDKQTSADSLPCLTCMRAFHGHYSHCKLSNNFDNWQPAAPVAPAVETPCPSCEKLRGEFAELKRFSSGLITKYNNLVNEMFALNQAKGEK